MNDLTLANVINHLTSFWNSFINSFCKVEFLCFNNEPNWMGYIVLFFFFMILLAIIVSPFQD